MKKGILSAILGAVMVGGAALTLQQMDAPEKAYYVPRSSESAEQSAQGSAAYWQRIRANQVTGQVDPADVAKVQRKIEDLSRQKTTALNLQWEEVGPGNLGGRSRSLLFDKDDPQIMYVGSVSGGIFKSTNGGRSWNPVDDNLDNMAIVSLAQGSDGAIYAGTGEGMYYFNSGDGGRGIIGAGIFKSTDGGQTFQQLASTAPSTNGIGAWTAVGKLGVDPNNPNRVYAATNTGLQISDDGGDSWTSGISGSQQAQDMVVTPSGAVWVKQGDRMYKSASGDPNTFTEITGGNMPRLNFRMRMAVSPQDENYAYVVAVDQNSRFFEAYRTTDGGSSWTVIGSRNTFLNPHRNQGNFNNSLVVDPKNKDRVIIGGVELWEWSANGGWQQIATLSRFNSVFYVHADNHNITYHPTRPTTIFICNDGGVFKSEDDGFTWTMENKGYGSIQFYGISVGLNDEVLGGTQDNSNILVDPNAAIPGDGEIYFSGDGGLTAISHLNPNIWFLSSQYGNLQRTFDRGENFSRFYSSDVTGRRSGQIGQQGQPSFADFVTPFALHEELFDPQSGDSIAVVADTIATSYGFGNGDTVYAGSFNKPQASALFVAESFKARAGAQELVSDANGNLSGDGSGSFDPTTGAYTLVFDNPTNLEILVQAATRYNAGAPILLESATNDLPIRDSLDRALNPGDTAWIIDPVSSLFAVGLTAYNNSNEPTNKYGGVWVTREALTALGTPEWWHVGELADGEIPTVMSFSENGDLLFVGTNFGRVHRISNLDQARNRATADIDDEYTVNGVINSTSVVEERVIFSSSQAITGIGSDPENPDRLIITLGNYGNSSYVWYTDRAQSPNLNNGFFTNVTGNLPEFPVYDAVFNYNDPDGGEVVLGTEFGVWTTENIDANNVTWTQEIAGLANVPAFDLFQTRTVRYDVKTNQDFEGTIYVGTHGRGIFKTNTTADFVGVDEEPLADAEPVSLDVLGMYPNPARNLVTLELSLESRSDVEVRLRDLGGKLLRTEKYRALPAQTEDVSFDVNGLKPGTYLVQMFAEGQVKSGKLVVSE